MQKHLIIIFILFSVRIFYPQNGIIRSYYPDGNLYYEISYVNDVLDGTSYWYYPNGNLKLMKEFSKGKLNGYVREFYESGLIKEEFYVKDGIKDGTHRIYYENGALKEINIYEEGKLLSSNKFEYDPNYIAPPESYLAGNRQQELLKKKKQELICDVDICPIPIGGMKTIQDNLIYPEHALMYGLEGEVILIASIDEKGDVINTEVIKGLGLGCNEAAEEAVKKTKFIPGQKDGKVVPSRVTLKVEFKIFDKTVVLNNGLNNEKNKVEKTDISLKFDIQSKVTSENQTYKDIRKKTEIICNYDECPYPVGGLRSINDHLEIPFIAKRLKLKGEIIIEAAIDKFGIVRDTKVIQGIGYGCDEAVESALMRTKFNPARLSNKDVDAVVKIIFPFDYND
ncbi:MAG: TonB family protein [Melioribacter sp.]|uniref:TonB family protein n=1 Tax=Rosettibacter primus TaxID=3111523 RepID=UPI00247C6185|nr:TonB family protein [Melioribacter sp.]